MARQGAWRRRVDGEEHFVEPGSGFFRRVGEITEVAHFEHQLHTGTIIDVDPNAAPSPISDSRGFSGSFLVTPEVQLTHRLLIAGLRAPLVDHAVVQDRIVSLMSAAVTQRHPQFLNHAGVPRKPADGVSSTAYASSSTGAGRRHCSSWDVP